MRWIARLLRMAGTLAAASAVLHAAGATAQDKFYVPLLPWDRVIHGADASDQLAYGPGKFDIGDLSGDGVPDFAMTAIFGDGPGEARLDSGEVHVVFGPFVGVRDLRDRPADVVVHGAVAGEALGASILVADLDADGQDDLVFGSRDSGRGGLSRRGEACILFGPLTPRVLDLAAEDADLCILGGARGDLFGTSIASGDVSGDGVRDLVVGMTGYDGSVLGSGGVAVLHGPFAPGPARDLAAQPPELLIAGQRSSSNMGTYVNVGDISGDGIGDILAANSHETGPGGYQAGELLILFGGQLAGTRVDLSVTPPDVLVLGVRYEGHGGEPAVVGDLDGNGAPELYWSEPSGGIPSGRTYGVLGPLASGTVVDHVTRAPDIELDHSRFGIVTRSLDIATTPSGQRLLVGGEFCCQVSCPRSSSWFVLDRLPHPGHTDLELEPPLLTIGGWQASYGMLHDVDGDGGLDILMTQTTFDGPLGDRPAASALVVIPYEDRCEEPPVPLGPSDLRVLRSGDDVLLPFDATGLGRHDMGIDVFRGSIGAVFGRGAYDHQLLAQCGAERSPYVDAAAAAPGAEDVYYLATRACDDACAPIRLQASLGTSSVGDERPLPVDDPPHHLCP